MARSATNQRLRQHTAARLREVRRRSAAWTRAAHRGLALGAVALVLLACPAVARAQMGQAAMGPTAGLVNSGLQRFQNLSDNGPGWMYWGVNGADRGLGYRGSYMTLGGFVPMAEDDLGGFWAADLRSHLSEFGGFFSNVGAVRKQFIGGTLLGVGVYWDYDGDQNQYAATPIPVGLGNIYSFAGGQSYNQVGVSGEWLTDWGNLRSNGYIPVGETAQLVGPFIGNAVLCQNGVNAALGGADLEVGAYIPGLSDWAGMISVGGYALGNTRYTFPNGAAAVPWFGGVYTRLDMTFIKNWDFSLQANNDSFFDWTGFARLTYRMGGSRRRNVPDQMEQPMMRNEHIVRARQVPEVAINPATGTPYRVFHVDNSATGAGTGTAESPFTTLTPAQSAATNPYDIVYVHVGNSATAPYFTPPGGYSFLADNQYLIGEGSSLVLRPVDCRPQQLFAGDGSGRYPIISNPLGSAIAVNQPGTQVNHLQILGSPVGISDGAGLAAPGAATINDVIVTGAPGIVRRGIEITASTGTFQFTNVRLESLENSGVVVSSAATVNLQNSSLRDIGGTGVRTSGASAQINVTNSSIVRTTGNGIDAGGPSSRISLTSGTIASTVGNAVVASGPSARVDIVQSRIANTSGSALLTGNTGVGAVVSATNVVIVDSGSTAPAIDLQGGGSNITIASTQVERTGGLGARVQAANSTFTMRQSRMRNIGSSGVSIEAPGAFARILENSTISNVVDNGIVSTGGAVQLNSSTIDGVGATAILAAGVAGATANTNIPGGLRAVWVQGATIRNAQAGGIAVTDSDLRVERADPTSTRSLQTTISNAGNIGVQALANTVGPYQVLVESANISGVSSGIVVAANDAPILAPPTINFTSRNNSITTSGSGAGINISAQWDPDPAPPPPTNNGEKLSAVNALITGNSISVAGPDDILLTSVGGPLQYPAVAPNVGVIPVDNPERPISIAAGSQNNLGGLNNGANVVNVPAATAPADNINFNSGLTVPLPPLAPVVP